MAIWGAWLDGHAWIMRTEVRRRMAAPQETVAAEGPAPVLVGAGA